MNDRYQHAGQSADEIRQEVLDELVEDGVISAEQAETGQMTGEDGGVVIDLGGDQPLSTSEECQDMDVGEMPDWMASRLTPERLQVVCERVIADDGKAFLGKLLDNVPAALFILLPLMALILKILYPLSKRYYVEHLLFVIHFHAFVFLILTLQILFGRLTTFASLPDAVSGIAVFAVSLYIPVYFYKAMRRVYEQGHVLSSLKFIVLLTSYFFGLSFILLFAALFAAFSI